MAIQESLADSSVVLLSLINEIILLRNNEDIIKESEDLIEDISMSLLSFRRRSKSLIKRIKSNT